MQQLLLDVETLAFEAHEDDVVDRLLTTDGVLSARFDLLAERLDVTFDPGRVERAALVDILTFFGLVVRAA